MTSVLPAVGLRQAATFLRGDGQHEYDVHTDRARAVSSRCVCTSDTDMFTARQVCPHLPLSRLDHRVA